MDGTSRVNREVYARFCERLGVKFPWPTRRRRLTGVPTATVRPSAGPKQEEALAGASPQRFGHRLSGRLAGQAELGIVAPMGEGSGVYQPGALVDSALLACSRSGHAWLLERAEPAYI